MHWFLIHCKPRQEKVALLNLERQGYECYLPMLHVEKLGHEGVKVVAEPLFPRYLFIRLGQGADAKSWAPIRSTKGVSRLVSFGAEPAQINDIVVAMLRSQENALRQQPQSLFKAGEVVSILAGAFTGLQGVFAEMEGERRAMVLIDFLSRPVKVPVNAAGLRKLG